MDEKRFTVDGLTIAENSPKGRKYLLEYQGGVNALCNRINGLFDKSERLEKENKEIKHENVNIMSDLDYFRTKCGSCEEGLFQQDKEIAKLKKENSELQLIKQFAENNGIHILSIEDAFRRCWNDNGKLTEENIRYEEHIEDLTQENKQLKEDNEFAGLLANHRGEMVSFANALIQDLDDEKIKDMWEKFKDEMYKEWKQKRGIE